MVPPRGTEPFQPTIPPQPARHSIPSGRIGCDLGDRAVLWQGEEIYCFLHKRDVEWRKPDGTAVARDGSLFIGDRRAELHRRGAWLQAVLRSYSRRSATSARRLEMRESSMPGSTGMSAMTGN